MRLARALCAGALAALLLAGVSACGGNGGLAGPAEPRIGILDPSLDPDAGLARQDVRLGPGETAAALRIVKELASTAAAALGPNDLELIREDAKPLQADIAPTWETVGPTVKDRDPATYGTLEEVFPALEAAVAAQDAAAAGAASDRIAASVDDYIERFPSEDAGVPGPELTPSEEPSEEPSGASAGSMPDFAGPQPTATATPTAGSEL